MAIIAHRGASSEAPENTLAAVRLAWEDEADAVEIDVHLSQDGELVVIHDEDLARTGGRAAKVGDLTFDELRTIDVGVWKGEEWRGQKIPSLDEVLRLLPPGKRLFIEIKCGEKGLPALKGALECFGGTRDSLVLICFSLDVLTGLKRTVPWVRTYWLHGSDRLDDAIRKASSAGVDGLDLEYSRKLDRDFVRRARQANLEVCVWTVDSPDAARQLAEMGVRGITTNRAGWLRIEAFE